MTTAAHATRAMSQEHAATVEGYRSAFAAALERDGFGRDPAWLRELRHEAIACFSQLGFPVARRGNEVWKYTDVSPIAARAFPVATWGPPVHLPHTEIEHHAFAGSQLSRLVFVNGRYVAEYSSSQALPENVVLCNLADALATHADIITPHLSRYAGYQADAFTALNTAFMRDGTFLFVPDGIEVPGPIQLIFVSTGAHLGSASHPRLLTIMGRDSKATLIETHAALAEGSYFTNAVSELVLGPGASLSHYKLQHESTRAFHIATTQVAQGPDSSYASLLLDTGGGLVRHNLNVLLDHEGASTKLSGLYLLTGEQHVDYSTFIDHAVPYTGSDELYKGVLGGDAHVVFGGKMLVRHGAQKISSHQTNKTLLLSDGASVDTKPQLEIYADDVKCSHGAAIGQLDREALFYLESRGLGEAAAKELLTYGFVSEVSRTIAHIPFRAYLDQLVHTRLRDM